MILLAIKKRNYEKIFLGIILLISTSLELLMVFKNGYGNTYYAAAVRSMLRNWHNFFFVSFDPSGFISIDKPPVAFWFQTFFAKILGFHGWVLLLPQAIAQVLSVWLLYKLIKHTSGSKAGLLAAFILAITPINVVVGSTNEVDTILVFSLLVAAWFLFQAVESKKLYHLLVSFFFIAIGFNIKMLQAYLVLPTFMLTYFVCVPIAQLYRIRNLTIAVYFLLIISLSWAICVDLTPKQYRPYVGSSDTNSVLHLALGYNGIQRITGNLFGRIQNTRSFSSASDRTGDALFVGNASLYRFFDQDFGGQIGWLIPFGFVSLISLIVRKKLSFPITDPGQRASIFWGMWFITCIVIFSIAGFIHPYYNVMLGPAVAGLVGIGSFILWEDFQGLSWKRWFFPLAILCTVIGQIIILSFYSEFAWLIPYIIYISLTSIVILYVIKNYFRSQHYRIQIIIYSILLLVLLVTSITWIGYSLIHSINQTIPAAGPTPGGNNISIYNNKINTTKLIPYLEKHQGKTKYLVGTESFLIASDLIIRTGKAVLTWGGFNGIDQAITLSQLKQEVNEGIIRYFYIESTQPTDISLPQQIGRTRATSISLGIGKSIITQWVTHFCIPVPTDEWQGKVQDKFDDQKHLYFCTVN